MSGYKNNCPTLLVRDTGIGIAEEYLPNLFEKFSQETQGYTRSFDGSGLGLALVKEYCKINNATIRVDSIKGKAQLSPYNLANQTNNHFI